MGMGSPSMCSPSGHPNSLSHHQNMFGTPHHGLSGGPLSLVTTSYGSAPSTPASSTPNNGSTIKIE
jgi:hypothetical protein